MPVLTPSYKSQSVDAMATLPQMSIADVFEGVALLLTSSAGESTRLIRYINREIIKSLFGIDPAVPSKWWGERRRLAFYNGVERILEMSGALAATQIRVLTSLLPLNKPIGEHTSFLIYVLNGVLGDHLVTQNNPLAMPMTILDRYGMSLGATDVGEHVVVFINGLCLSPASWDIGLSDSLPEQYLQADPNATVLFVGYNTGRRISKNGWNLAVLMQHLCQSHPNIKSIKLIGHSMGGLVARSGLFYAKQEHMRWLNMVTDLVCLGSPHHGAVLERIGFYVQDKLGDFPLGGAIAKLADIRSAGIMDLRYGSIRHDDWEFLDQRVGYMDDHRLPAPLPSAVNTVFVAGSIQESAQNTNLVVNILGDYLVSIPSALGEHPNPTLALKLPEGNKKVFYGVSHTGLQYNEAVIAYVVGKLTEPKIAALMH